MHLYILNCDLCVSFHLCMIVYSSCLIVMLRFYFERESSSGVCTECPDSGRPGLGICSVQALGSLLLSVPVQLSIRWRLRDSPQTSPVQDSACRCQPLSLYHTVRGHPCCIVVDQVPPAGGYGDPRAPSWCPSLRIHSLLLPVVWYLTTVVLYLSSSFLAVMAKRLVW